MRVLDLDGFCVVDGFFPLEEIVAPSSLTEVTSNSTNFFLSLGSVAQSDFVFKISCSSNKSTSLEYCSKVFLIIGFAPSEVLRKSELLELGMMKFLTLSTESLFSSIPKICNSFLFCFSCKLRYLSSRRRPLAASFFAATSV